MGLVLCLKTASDADIALMLATPRLVLRFLEETEEQKEATRALIASGRLRIHRGGLRRRLINCWKSLVERVQTPSPARSDFGRTEEETDLDKAWHGIHWLLAGNAEGGEPPLASLLVGGAEIGKVEVGYGTARAMTAAETLAFHDAIAAVGTAALRERFDAEAMEKADIYPTIWNEGVEEAFDEYIAHYFEQLKEFVAKAVAAKKGLIVWIS